MSTRAAVRAGVLLFVAGAICGLAYATARPLIAPSQPAAIVASDASARARAAALNPFDVKDIVLNLLKAKATQTALQAAALNALKAKAGQVILSNATDAALKAKGAQTALQTALKAPPLQPTLQKATATALSSSQLQAILQAKTLQVLTAATSQTKIDSVIASGVQTAAVQQQLSKTFLPTSGVAANSAQLGGVPASNFTQGPAQIFSDQATSAGGNFVTVLTVPGLLHVTGVWWPSDGTVGFDVVNDSAATLDFGGDFNGFPYQDTLNPSTTEFGQASPTGLSAADGTIAPGASESFQITPAPDAAVDLPSQQVPYRGEAHLQVTAPGSKLATLDVSAYEIAQNGGIAGTGGSALLSAQAVVGPA